MAKVWSWYLDQNRSVAEVRGLDAGDDNTVRDEIWERVAKAVPVEIVGAYTAVVPVVALAGTLAVPLLAVTFVLGLVGTYAAMAILREVKVSHQDPGLRRIARIQVGVALLAFVAWAYANGGVFAALGWFNGAIAFLAMVTVGVVILFANKLTGAPST